MAQPVHLSFGGCGFLLAFHIGVAKYMRRHGVLTAASRFAGASGGSLVAASLAYGIPLAVVLEETKATATLLHEDIRASKRGLLGAKNLAGYVYRHIDALFPDPLPVLHPSTSDPLPRLVVATTEVFPRLRTVHWSSFATKNDLANALLISCHVPWYFDGTPARQIAGTKQWHTDGGLLQFVPDVPDHIPVNVFPLPWMNKRRTISPLWIHGFPISLAQLSRWALLPPPNDVLDQFVVWGEEAAHAYVTSSAEWNG
ncbi:hypothetical protein DYB32_002575 [Aphanomyces invadans]|uniref:PNPLA domain-containing protein n=1 Tax=Aphanomyces invadans TaxID=157072 RepID=A0A418B2Y2_9STRA|nr:hypothetical protein DYB32_002575 [Aphanomyces invadans]